MKEINNKIKELLLVSALTADTMDESIVKTKRQDEILNELKTLAKEKKTLIGRTLKFSCQDFYALYIILTVNRNTVGVRWIDYSDGLQDDRCGVSSNVDLQFAQEQIYWEDSIAQIVSSNVQ